MSQASRKKAKTSVPKRKVPARPAERVDRAGVPPAALLLILALIVAVIVSAVHWPALSARALCFEDHKHALHNPLVQNPGWESIGRLLGEVLEPSAGGYYKPLAFLSLMGDAALGGRVDNLRPFRRTSLALHVINTLLVMVLLHQLFNQPVVAAMLATLFGLHPLMVESIPWAAERKNLLAAFFGLCCLVCYVRYAHRGRRWTYGGVLAAYVLALMSKPTATMLPGLLLLLDYWPLRRLNWRALIEKVPFIAIGAVSAAITFISQARTAAVSMPTEHGFWQAPLVVCHNIVFYLYKIVWPANLSAHYPHPEPLALSHPMVLAGVIGTGLLIVALAISLRWTPAWAVGWVFFFIAILPALGVVGFMIAIAADRFAYLPVVGFLLPLAWLLGQAWLGWSQRPGGTVWRVALVVVVLVVATAEAVGTRRYLTRWRNSETLYNHMLAEAPNAAIVHYGLGYCYETQDRLSEAEAEYRQALRFREEYPEAHYNLGVILMRQGKADQAMGHYREALRLSPDFIEPRNNLAGLLMERGELDEAIEHYRHILRAGPDLAPARAGLGVALAKQGRFDDAVEQFRRAVRIEPGNAAIRYLLGNALKAQGRHEQAAEQYRQVLRIDPNHAEARRRLQSVDSGQP